MPVSLATYMHDPHGQMLMAIEERMPLLSQMYDDVYVVPTDASDAAVIEQLGEIGCVVELQRGGVGPEFIGNARRMAVSMAAEGSRGHIHFSDMDRVLQWAGSHPEELRSVIRLIPRHDFLIIGRTQNAVETHPRSQVETERLANRVCSLIIGQEVDVTAASRGLSPEAAALILRYSKTKGVRTDSEWPVIVHCKSEMPIGYIEVEGLEYEDWLRHTDEVEKAGGLDIWKRAIDENPAAWLHRINCAHMIAETAISTYRALSQIIRSA
jgi:hypothetical protein